MSLTTRLSKYVRPLDYFENIVSGDGVMWCFLDNGDGTFKFMVEAGTYYAQVKYSPKLVVKLAKLL
jgi:hypothetical protein